RRFGPFFWTQFLGAFNDNLLKFAVTLAITYNDSLRGDYSVGLLINLVAALFILPCFLFSATSGQLADKLDKAKVMQLAKWLELPIVLLTALGFALESVWLLVLAVFLLGSQSAFFGPAKYAYLPSQLQASELVAANALVQTATFVAILLGTIVAGSLLSQAVAGPIIAIVCAIGLVVAGLGIFNSLRIPKTPSENSGLKVNWNLFSASWHNVKQVRSLKLVWPSLLGISWLWFVGATYLTQFPLLSKSILNASPGVATFLLFLFTVGLGAGAFLCEAWSRKRIEFGLVPIGLSVMVVSGLALHALLIGHDRPNLPITLVEFLATSHAWLLIVAFLFLSAGVGLYSVPLYASIQAFSPVQIRSRTIAANNILNSFFMVTSAAMAVTVLALSGGNVVWVFFAVTVLSAVVLLIWVVRQPHTLLRCVGLLQRSRTKSIDCNGAHLLKGQDPALIVFPSLLHEQTMQRLMSLPVPFTVVLSGRMHNTFASRWLRNKGFVLDISGLKELEGQKTLLTHIAKAMSKGKVVAIDQAMFNLLTQRFKLNELPATLNKKNICMQMYRMQPDGGVNQGSSVESWCLTHID
ncbi:MAG: MFS transporter, partial [Limnobacter sp.]|nr:MFS transporter [Limnobacter sp.]